MPTSVWRFRVNKTPAVQAVTKTAITRCILWASINTKIEYCWGKASVDDIISIMSAIDENGMCGSLPTFCAATRSRVPDIPDEQSDIASIRQNLKQVRQQLECLMSKFMLAEESKCLVTEKHDEDRDGLSLSSPLTDDSHRLSTAQDIHSSDHCLSTCHDNFISAGKQSSESAAAQPVPDRVVTYAETAERNNS